MNKRKSLLSSLEEMEIERDDILSMVDTTIFDDSLTSETDRRKILLIRYPKRNERPRTPVLMRSY